jgi:hypothetical protein
LPNATPTALNLHLFKTPTWETNPPTIEPTPKDTAYLPTLNRKKPDEIKTESIGRKPSS